MFARTTTWSGSPEALQKWADHAVNQVMGFVKGLPGNAGVEFLIDRDGGTALTLTLWETGEHASATDQFAEQAGRRPSPRPARNWSRAAATRSWPAARLR